MSNQLEHRPDEELLMVVSEGVVANGVIPERALSFLLGEPKRMRKFLKILDADSTFATQKKEKNVRRANKYLAQRKLPPIREITQDDIEYFRREGHIRPGTLLEKRDFKNLKGSKVIRDGKVLNKQKIFTEDKEGKVIPDGHA